MIIIADSGSTKCDWMLVEAGKSLVEFSTMGFNPYFVDNKTIIKKLEEKEVLHQYATKVNDVFFYGAGCSSGEMRNILSEALAIVFPKAKIYVSHDLNGAALATYTGEPHIAGILGTGSNSCFFDGKQIYEEIPALAYILGDEGSGSYYGKELLADFLYRRMPPHLQQEFEASYQLSKESIMTAVYRKPHANVYLASFTRFCSLHRTEPYIQKKIIKGMHAFLETHVLCYKNAKSVPVNFVGSIAWHFQAELKEVG
ncbi:MAG TPA: hypothetical protein ENJ82_14370, partial [Bacteroidetes bacterium]|nr:hypothetical protein [Bacteroidota bacterium]